MVNATLERPFVRTPEQMGVVLKRLEKTGYELRRLDTLMDAADEKHDLVTRLKTIDPTLNGNADALIQDLALYRQEAGAKKRWSAWEFIKSIPGKLWGVVKRHPKTSILIATAALAAAAYYTGFGGMAVNYVKKWLISKFPSLALGQAAETAGAATAKVGELAAGAASKGEVAAGALKTAAEGVANTISVPPAPVVVPSLPNTLPGAAEAADILRSLE